MPTYFGYVISSYRLTVRDFDSSICTAKFTHLAFSRHSDVLRAVEMFSWTIPNIRSFLITLLTLAAHSNLYKLL